MHPSSPQSLHRVLAIAALWVLGLGLPQLLVVCTGADGSRQLEFAHAPGTCCKHARPARCATACGAGCDDGKEQVLPSRRCSHVSFAIELAPPQSGTTTSLDNPPAIGWVQHADVRSAVRCAVSLLPPSTGPPRTDQTAALRATTLLLL